MVKQMEDADLIATENHYTKFVSKRHRQ
jgi:hypothetical protein